MPTLRFHALREIGKRKPVVITEKGRRSELFGKNVFNEEAMRQFMTDEAFNSVMNAIRYGTKIDRKVADQVAAAMRDWAISKGATHYTHWFQPLTGTTAEKHDAFSNPQVEAEPLKNSVADNWYNKSPTLRVSQMEASEIPLKLEVIPLGTPPLLPSFTEQHFVSLPYLYPTPEKLLTIKLRYLKHYKPLTKQQPRWLNILIKTLQKLPPP